MTDEEIHELADAALEAAIRVPVRDARADHPGDLAGHHFKIHDALTTFVRDELPVCREGKTP